VGCSVGGLIEVQLMLAMTLRSLSSSFQMEFRGGITCDE
jgi:hypothetical protein